jgi:LacI family transcriptional regulator
MEALLSLLVARLVRPTLSSIPVPGQAVGAAGMRLMGRLLDGRRIRKKHVTVSPPPVVRRESTGGRVTRDADMERARQMIEQYACRGLTVEQLVDRLAVSQKTLNKHFLKAYGHLPGSAIRQVRLDRAKGWLDRTNLTVGRIADMCGFSEHTSFNFFFKRATGCTPSEYRERSRRE